MTTGGPEVDAHWRSLSMQFQSFTTSVVTNILTSVPSKKEKLPLSVTHPELAKEADGWDPSIFTAGSSRKLNWQCSKGHTWDAVIRNRSTLKSKCPVCANQKVLAGFNDLQTTHPELAKEANGWEPSSLLAGSRKKLSWKCENGHTWEAVLSSRSSGGNGCPYCSGNQVLAGLNDLATTHPDLAAEAVDWDPTKISAGSHKKQLWKCDVGHRYEARVDHRARGASNCHFCSGHKYLKGFNDLNTTNPEIASEADGWNPTNYYPQKQNMKWKCVAGHKWVATIDDRRSGNGCPSCAKTGFSPELDGFLYFLKHPEWEMYQVGITNIPDDRLGRHRRLGWIVLEVRGPIDGHLAQQWETAILRMLKAKGADLSNTKIAGKFDGYSEAWSKTTFEVKTIKELMAITEEWERKDES